MLPQCARMCRQSDDSRQAVAGCTSTMGDSCCLRCGFPLETPAGELRCTTTAVTLARTSSDTFAKASLHGPEGMPRESCTDASKGRCNHVRSHKQQDIIRREES